MFLKRLKDKDSNVGEIDGGARGMEEFLSNDGTNKGHVIFCEQLHVQEVTQSMECFKANFKGISLAIGAVGLDVKVLSVFEMSEWK